MRDLRQPSGAEGKLPKTRLARRDFAAMVRKGTASAETLPLTHITDAYMFRQIMEVEALAPSGCPVFEEELLYLFYGRPAYRAADEETSNGIDAYWPICFVMMPSDVTPKRVYPFDSGAFHHKRYAEFMYHRMIKEDFELESDPSMPGRLVSLFWSDIQGYFENKGPRDFVPGHHLFFFLIQQHPKPSRKWRKTWVFQ